MGINYVSGGGSFSGGPVSSPVTVPAGGGSGTVILSGLLTINLTPAANVGATETVLMTYSLPANSLNQNNRGIRFTFWGRVIADMNAKSVKIYFGALALTFNFDVAVSLARPWKAVLEIFRTASNAQRYVVTLWTTDSASAGIIGHAEGTLAQTDTGAIVIKCGGTGTVSNQVFQDGFFAEFMN